MSNHLAKGGRMMVVALDEGLINNQPSFLYITKHDPGGDELVLRYHADQDNVTDITVSKPEKGRRIHTANLVTDTEYNILAIVWFYEVNGRHEAYFARVKNDCGIAIEPAMPIPFPNVLGPLMVRLVPSGDHFYFACVDSRPDLPWRFCLATLDIDTLEPTSRVTEMDIEVSETYSDANLRQLARNLTLVSDRAGGAFLQLVNTLNHIETYQLNAPLQHGAVGYQLLYSLAHDEIGYHATLFDEKRSRLVTCFSVFPGSGGQQPVLAYSQPIFSSPQRDAAEEPDSQVPTFVPLSVRPGAFYRPEISSIPDKAGGEGTYLVSWEGEKLVCFAEFTPSFDPTTIEHSIEGLTLPGNHRTIATPDYYGVCYQNYCDEPRTEGAVFESHLLPRTVSMEGDNSCTSRPRTGGGDVQSPRLADTSDGGETVEGAVNTNWLPGLNIFFDDINREYLRQCCTTALDQHLVGIYQTYINYYGRQIYGRVQSATGLSLQPNVLTPQGTGYDKDFHPAPIPGTNDFAAIWSSNDGGSYYRIYIRKYMVDGRKGIQYFNSELQLSGSDNHYVCPRLIYNEETQLFFACWVSLKEKALQGVWLSLSGQDFSVASYQVNITDQLYSRLLSSTAEIDAGNAERIVVMNHGDGVIIGLQESLTKINFFRVGRPVQGTPPVNLMTSYSQSSMERFDATFDPQSSHIMLVFNGVNNHIYGDRLRVFGKGSEWQGEAGRARDGSVMSPVTLNANAQTMRYPNIIALPKQEEEMEYQFLASWCARSSTTDPVFCARFDMYFNKIGREDMARPGSLTGPVELAASRNQLAMMFYATRFESSSLRSEGVLLKVTPNAPFVKDAD